MQSLLDKASERRQ